MTGLSDPLERLVRELPAADIVAAAGRLLRCAAPHDREADVLALSLGVDLRPLGGLALSGLPKARTVLLAHRLALVVLGTDPSRAAEVEGPAFQRALELVCAAALLENRDVGSVVSTYVRSAAQRFDVGRAERLLGVLHG